MDAAMGPMLRTWRLPYQRLESGPGASDSDDPESQLKCAANHDRHSKLWCLLPFFIASPLGLTSRVLPKPSSTSYINGLRGLACVIVLNQHFAISHDDWIYRPFGSPSSSTDSDDGDNHHLLQLPYLRVLHSGIFMVAIFFVLSGFVLSYAPLQRLTHPPTLDRDAALLSSISSSLLRRPVRLFAPLLVAISFTAVAVYLNPSYDNGAWRDNPAGPPLDASETPGLSAMWWRFICLALPLLNPYSWAIFAHPAFTHGWTMQLEWRGSIVIYLLCLLTYGMAPGQRKCVLALTACHAMAVGRWEVACFIEGMLIAELRHFSPSLPPFARYLRLSGLTQTILASMTLAFALLIGGWPYQTATRVQPYSFLHNLTPSSLTANRAEEAQGLSGMEQFYWTSIGAGLVLLSFENLPRLQAVFDAVPMRYLGEISFSFYLVHQGVVFCVGVPVYGWLRESIGFGVIISLVVEYLVVFVATLCIADLFWRAIDEKAVRLSRFIASFSLS